MAMKLLDAVVDYLPSPVDLPPVRGIDPATEGEIHRKPEDSEPFAALAFKIMSDPIWPRGKKSESVVC